MRCLSTYFLFFFFCSLYFLNAAHAQRNFSSAGGNSRKNSSCSVHVGEAQKILWFRDRSAFARRCAGFERSERLAVGQIRVGPGFDLRTALNEIVQMRLRKKPEVRVTLDSANVVDEFLTFVRRFNLNFGVDLASHTLEEEGTARDLAHLLLRLNQMGRKVLVTGEIPAQEFFNRYAPDEVNVSQMVKDAN